MSTFKITAAQPESALLDLPWKLPLEEWPEDILAALPRGISRHIVRFVRIGDRILAVKETRDHYAYREYELLKRLGRLDIPCVVPTAVITGRTDDNGEPLETCIVTEHLQYSLPYRAVFNQTLQSDTAGRLINALAVLLVRLHLAGFYWGDVSLSNTLFRRDADQFAAYLVDAETGDLHPALTDGQRNYDIDLARTNIIGELFDLQAGGFIPEDKDPIRVGDALVQRYNELWTALTEVESFSADEQWRVDERIRRLNDLGFDVGELQINTDEDGTTVRIQPNVVDAGHHSRRLLRLTGMDVQDAQAQRLLNDMDAWRSRMKKKEVSEAIAAHDWLINSFEPTIEAVPKKYRKKLEPAQLFHEILEHRWYMSEKQGRDVPMPEAAVDYVEKVLKNKPDEKALLQSIPGDTELIALNEIRDLADTLEGEAIAAMVAEDQAILKSLRDNSDELESVRDRPDPLAVAAEIHAVREAMEAANGQLRQPAEGAVVASIRPLANDSFGEFDHLDSGAVPSNSSNSSNSSAVTGDDTSTEAEGVAVTAGGGGSAAADADSAASEEQPVPQPIVVRGAPTRRSILNPK